MCQQDPFSYNSKRSFNKNNEEFQVVHAHCDESPGNSSGDHITLGPGPMQARSGKRFLKKAKKQLNGSHICRENTKMRGCDESPGNSSGDHITLGPGPMQARSGKRFLKKAKKQLNGSLARATSDLLNILCSLRWSLISAMSCHCYSLKKIQNFSLKFGNGNVCLQIHTKLPT